MPAMAAFLQGTSSNWNYKSIPQKLSCFGMRNNECALPRGKIIGGSSSINYMIYNRGNKRDFDEWEKFGNPGWSYKDVLPYFLKSEAANLKGLEDSPYHNKTGPLVVEYSQYRTGLVHEWIKAAREAGYKLTDYNGESQLGVSYVQSTTKSGKRWSAAKAFIEPIRARPNLQVMTFTSVTKVLISNSTKEAYGVEYVYRRKRYTALSRKEVIISAGAFNSPQILMLSGIGPLDNLNAIEVPVYKELPVGKTMYDHMCHAGPTFVTNTVGNSLKVQDLTINDVKNYLLNRPSKINVIGGVEALAFHKVNMSDTPDDLPDVEQLFISGSFASDLGTGLKEGANIRDDLYNAVYKPLEFKREDHFSTLIMHFHPKSRGRLWLHNRNPFEPPRIDPKYFKNPEDIEILLAGIKESIKIVEQPALKKIGTRLHDIPLPGKSV